MSDDLVACPDCKGGGMRNVRDSSGKSTGFAEPCPHCEGGLLTRERAKEVAEHLEELLLWRMFGDDYKKQISW